MADKEKKNEVPDGASSNDAELKDGEAGDGKKKGGKKKLILMLSPVLLAAAGAGVYFSGILGGQEPPAEVDEATKLKAEQPPRTYALPEMLINLNSKGKRRQSYLRLALTIEYQDDDTQEKLDQYKARIRDGLQLFLMEKSVDELRGAEGLYRLKEGVMMRVNTIIKPQKINACLINKFLIQ